MRHLELLAPARDIRIGIAAIDCGADAVYIAGPQFGARQAAGNSVEDIRSLCDYAHRFGARIFITLNTILYESELEEAYRFMLAVQDAGADAIIVSNHGGRVLPFSPATAEVLPEIAEAVKGKTKIIVDGGIRTGFDVFKALALGADMVMICRPILTAWYGAGREGIEIYVNKLKAELEDAMYMCGARKLSDITRDMIRF